MTIIYKQVGFPGVLICQENQSKNMPKSLTNFCLAAAFTAALVSAQTAGSGTHTPPTPAQMAQHRVQFLTTLLSLTADQQTQATTIFTNAATANATIHTSLKTAHTSLQTAIQNNDTATIDQTATAIGNLEGQSTATQAKADAAFYSILTADQKTKLGELGLLIGNLEGQSTATQAKADAAFYSILTADQKTKFTQLGSQG